MKVYHTYAEGFYGDFTSLDAVRDWARGLVKRYPDLAGKELKIWQGVRTGTVDVYPAGGPFRSMSLPA